MPVSEFQSLFFWNSRPDPRREAGTPRLQRVSILVFLELAPGLLERLAHSSLSSCFNPCFSGTRARTLGQKLDLLTFQKVSILVFLELAPGLELGAGGDVVVGGFNPCFSGTRARTQPALRHRVI